MSRNQDRLGGGPQQDNSPPQTNDGGFSFVIPTEFVELPSQGLFYTENHPLHNKESIEIKQMTAKEEDILTSRSLLKKGVVLDRLIQSLIIDKNIDASTLLVGDRNAIIIAARVSGYGNEYSTTVTCPSCGTEQKYNFDLNSANFVRSVFDQNLGVTNNDDGTFTCILPRTQVTVVGKLFTGREEKQLLSLKSGDGLISKQLESVIISVNGDSSPDAIKYLATNMPSFDSKHLRMVLKDVTPNIDLTQKFCCTSCGFTREMEVPLTAEFFWPE